MDIIAKLQNWLLKRVYQEDCVTLTSRRIYILPTREGIIYAILILIMLAAAINFNNSLVFFFTFLMAGVGIISMHMTQENLINLQFSIGHVKPVFCFQTLNLPLTISQSADKRRQKKLNNYSIAVQLAEHPAPDRADVYHNEATLVQLSSPTIQRGQFKLPSFTVSSRYPLGLFRAWANVELCCDAIVYPHPAKQADFEPQDGSDSEGLSSKGRGFDDFSGFKSYQPGESLKHVHWKAYAREQGLLTKTFSGSNNREYWINWNELSGDVEKRLSRLCRLVIEAEQRGDRYGLLMPGSTIGISQGQTHKHQCLKALALFKK